jgi:error-prone DNA polymerase
MAQLSRIPLLAVNDALYAHEGERDLQDVLTCIREGVAIEAAGQLLFSNSERHLKPPSEMTRLFHHAPDAIEEVSHFMSRIEFSLDQLGYQYPEESVPLGYTSAKWLAELTWRRAALCYPGGIPNKVKDILKDELDLISKQKYEPYFLTIYDIVQFAQSRGIFCQGRGSAANSAVCFVLGITSVDPAESDLLFARFISDERREPPDIDVDFEHERREEVVQYIYGKYSRDRAGIIATVISYRPRSAMRDVGNALVLTEDVTARLVSTQWGSWGRDIDDDHIRQAKLDPTNKMIRRAMHFARRILGFPRHLSQHVGGFVLARGRLDEIVPIGNAAMPNRTFIEWDKDDVESLGLMKVDILALGMLTCIRKSFDLMRSHGLGNFVLNNVPAEDTAVYDMLCQGDSIGVFQVESRAQINMLSRLRPRKLYDLVIQVAIVRPGPIQGNMVHPYLRRRAGLEEPDYPSPAPPHDPDELKQILKDTMGVPLFQEQAMKLAMVAAQFSEVEANQLRRAMATFRNMGTIDRFEQLMIARMVNRGYGKDFATRCYEQIRGFGSYGFPESHAASFAKLVYISSWIKCHHPEVFACALLNSQPMGFYAPAQIIRDAQEHGVDVRPVDINKSLWENSLELNSIGEFSLRLGFRQIEGISDKEASSIMQYRQDGFASFEEFSQRTRLETRILRLLADADSFCSVGLSRRQALWRAQRLSHHAPLPLFSTTGATDLGKEPPANLPLLTEGEQVAADYQTLRLSLKNHPMALLRGVFQAEGVASAAEAAACADGERVRVAGVVLVRQRPGKGTAIFVTLEDETGIVNIVIWQRNFEQFRGPVMGGRLLLVEGHVQKSPEGVVHLMTERVSDRSTELDTLSGFHATEVAIARADEVLRPQPARHDHPRNTRILPRSRDFH